MGARIIKRVLIFFYKVLYNIIAPGRKWFTLDFSENAFGDVLKPRDGAYMLIVKLDLGKDLYEPIRVPDNEWANMGLGKTVKISAWFKQLGSSPIIHDLDKERFVEFAQVGAMKECFLRGKKYPTFIHRRIKDKEYVLAVTVLEPSEDYSPENQEVFLYVIDIDRIYFRAYADVIERLGGKDLKTGVYNRNAFDMELIKISRSNENIGVMYADVNGLKYANSNYGRQTGDKIIKEFTDLLMHTFEEPTYKCYRVCGEEFVVIAEAIDFRTAKRFEKTVEKAKDYMWQHKPLASLGWAFGRGIEVGQLLDEAEMEMYKEKRKFYQAYAKFR